MIQDKIVLKELLKIASPPKLLIFLGLVISIFSTLITLALPLYIKDLIDSFDKQINVHTIIILLILFLVDIVCGFFSYYFLSKVAEEVTSNIRKKLWKKILKLEQKFHDGNKSSDLVSRMVNDTSLISSVLSSQLVEFITSLITIVLGTCLLFYIDPLLASIFLIIIPLSLFIILPLGKKIYFISDKKQQEYSNLTTFLIQRLNNIKLVKSLNMDESEYLKGSSIISNLKIFGLNQAKIKAFILPVLSAVILMIILLLVGVGVWRVSNNYIALGAFSAFIIYVFQIAPQISQIGNFLTEFQEARGATIRIFDLISEDEKSPNDKDLINKLNISSGVNIEFKNVNFSYNNKTIIKNLDLQIPFKSYFAIIGPSGSGKSTIFSLLENFYSVNSGEININNININKINSDMLRKLFTYVSQETFLFSGTIKENLMYGINETVTEEHLYEASKKANIHDFIISLPEGYNTVLNENGNNFSGGQKQRLSLARAFLRKSPIYLFDEVTANLDSLSEKVIKNSILELSQTSTVIVIAHRMSTVQQADQFLVLNPNSTGKIGTYNDLSKNDEFFKIMLNSSNYS